WPIPPDITVDHCAEWSNIGESDESEQFPYSADVHFELPLSADNLFLISRSVRHRGVFAAGRVNYVQSEDLESDSVQVDITARFWLEEYLDASKACLLKRDENETGVGIFTKREHTRRERGSNSEKLRMEVTVTFPRTSDDSTLSINNLTTDLGVYSQIFTDMNNVNFNSLSLRSALGPISAESLRSEDTYISTHLGPIEGTFNATKSLVLSTSNAPINVDVNLFNEHEGPATLKMRSSNGYIRANISLESSKDSDAAFNITSHTSHGPTDLVVLTSPLDSTLSLHAITSIGAASVKLPSTYEGAFAAYTSFGSLNVRFDENAEDPSGEGRKRSVETDYVGRTGTHGRVGWSEERLARGTANVRSSFAPVTLEF
ncbi:hypothetical protein B0H11DRAFT_1700386, partial [Mycena galericulata]